MQDVMIWDKGALINIIFIILLLLIIIIIILISSFSISSFLSCASIALLVAYDMIAQEHVRVQPHHAQYIHLCHLM